MAEAIKIYKIKTEDFTKLKQEGRILIDGTWYTYDPKAVYVTPDMDANIINLATRVVSAEAAIDSTISGTYLKYAQNTSATVAPVSGWVDICPEWRDGYYIWQKYIIEYTNGTITESVSCITGTTGARGPQGLPGEAGGIGPAGESIYSIVIDNNFDTIPAFADGHIGTDYAWQDQTLHTITVFYGSEQKQFKVSNTAPTAGTDLVIVYTISQSENSEHTYHSDLSYVPGATGTSISSYQAYITGFYSNDTLKGTIKYTLYEGTVPKCYTEFKAIKAKTGATGISVDAITEFYQKNNDTTPPTFSAATIEYWYTTPCFPDASAPYLWNAEKIDYNDGQGSITTVYNAPAMIAKYVTDGVSIDKITNYYLLTTKNADKPTFNPESHTGWTTEFPARQLTEEHPWCWNCEVITYDSTAKDPTISDVTLIASLGEDAFDYSFLSSAPNFIVSDDRSVISPSSITFTPYITKNKQKTALITGNKPKWEYKWNNETTWASVTDVYNLTISYSEFDANKNSLEVKMSFNDIMWDNETIGVILNGTNGTSPYKLDISNDFDSIPADHNGIIGSSYDWDNQTKHILKAYYGADQQDFTIGAEGSTIPSTGLYVTYDLVSDTNLTYKTTPEVVNKACTVSIKLKENKTSITGNKKTIIYKLYANGTIVSQAKFEITVLLAGEDGENSIDYWLTPTATTFRIDKNGVITPGTITVSGWSQEGSSTATQLSNCYWGYKIGNSTEVRLDAQTLTFTAAATSSGSIIPTNKQDVTVTLYASNSNNIVYDIGTISCIKDGESTRIESSADACTQIGDAYINEEDGCLYILNSLNPKNWTNAGKIVGEDGEDGVDGTSGITLNISNDFDSVPCTSSGVVPDNYDWNVQTGHSIYATIGATTLQISHRLVTEVQPNWNDYYIVYENVGLNITIDTGSSEGTYSSYAVHAGESGDGKIRQSGFNGTNKGSITYKLYIGQTLLATAKFELSKLNAGQAGQNAVDKYISTNTSTVVQDNNESMSPASVTFSFYSQEGNSTPTAYNGYYEVSIDSVAEATGSGTSYTIATNNLKNKKTISLTLYNSNTTDKVKLDTETVNIVYNGAPGSAGYNTATVLLYQKAASTPEGPQQELTYNFAQGKITSSDAALGSWKQKFNELDSSDNPIYITAAIARSTGDTDTIGKTEWTAPIIYTKNGEDGEDGDPGINTATVLLYQRSSSTPYAPSTDIIYTFADGTLSGDITPWQLGIPSGSDQCWVTHAAAIGTGATCTIAQNDWSNPVVLVKNGSDGNKGTSVSNVATYYCLSNIDWVGDIPTDSDIGSTVGKWSTSPSAFNNDSSYKYYQAQRIVYDNNSVSWSSAVLASMLSVDFLNAIGITAKKVTVTDGATNTIFNADSTQPNAVTIGGFTANSSALYTNDKRSISDGKTGVHLGNDGIALGASFSVDNEGSLFAKSGTIGAGLVFAGGGGLASTIDINGYHFVKVSPPAYTNLVDHDSGTITYTESNNHISAEIQVYAEDIGDLNILEMYCEPEQDPAFTIDVPKNSVGEFGVKSSKTTGFQIGSKSLYNGKTYFGDTLHTGIYLGTDGIEFGLGSQEQSNSNIFRIGGPNGEITIWKFAAGSDSKLLFGGYKGQSDHRPTQDTYGFRDGPIYYEADNNGLFANTFPGFYVGSYGDMLCTGRCVIVGGIKNSGTGQYYNIDTTKTWMFNEGTLSCRMPSDQTIGYWRLSGEGIELSKTQIKYTNSDDKYYEIPWPKIVQSSEESGNGGNGMIIWAGTKSIARNSSITIQQASHGINNIIAVIMTEKGQSKAQNNWSATWTGSTVTCYNNATGGNSDTFSILIIGYLTAKS